MQRVDAKCYGETSVSRNTNGTVTVSQEYSCVTYSPAEALELASALVGAAMEAARREVEAASCD
jgi:hypothetical protein